MRVHLDLKNLTNRWIVLTIAVWSILALLAVVITMVVFKTSDLHSAEDLLERDIHSLTVARERIEQEKTRVGFDDKKISEILTELVTSSKRAGVRLGETELGDVESRGTHIVIPVTVSIKGNYNQIGMFVNILEHNLRFKIMEVSLSTKETKGSGILTKLHAEYVIL
jgi:hypothetical protein